jgi:hypothetical protein
LNNPSNVRMMRNSHLVGSTTPERRFVNGDDFRFDGVRSRRPGERERQRDEDATAEGRDAGGLDVIARPSGGSIRRSSLAPSTELAADPADERIPLR